VKSIAIVGATGLVGRTILKLLEEREYPVGRLSLFASKKSAGMLLQFRGEQIPVQPLNEHSGRDVTIAFFSAGGAVSRDSVPQFVAEGGLVIDNSSAFRMEPDVPLVVPEVNPEEIRKAHGIVSNPNCSTIQLVVVLAPLHRRFRLQRVVVSTYQSVSGKGFKGVRELRSQQEGRGKAAVFPRKIADNLVPLIDEAGHDGYCLEEIKLMRETKKILNADDLRITATAVRVPIPYCHSESVNLEFASEIDCTRAETVLENSPGIRYCPGSEIPSPLDAVGSDDVWVGRLRQDESQRNSLNLWIVADNVRKGAALNAVQIAEAAG
jgi:aspartate-semialdehyde dehydrogenase